jgi:hypothetical protein
MQRMVGARRDAAGQHAKSDDPQSMRQGLGMCVA